MARHCPASTATCILLSIVLVLGSPAELRESTTDKMFAQLADFVSEFTDISVASLKPFSAQKLFGCVAKDKLKALNDHCTCCLVQDSKIPPIPDVAACMLSKSGTFDLSTGLLQSDKLVANLIGESSLPTEKKASATAMFTNCLSSSLNDMVLPKRFLQSIPLEGSSAPLQNPEVPPKNMTAFRAILCAAKSLNANGCDQRSPLKTEQKQRVAREVSVTSGTNVDPKDKNNNITQTVKKNVTDTGRIVFIGGKRKKVVHVQIVTDIEKFTENVTTILRTDGSSETRKINHHTHNNTIEHDNKYVDIVGNGTDGDSSGMNGDNTGSHSGSTNGDNTGSHGGGTNSDGSVISKSSLNGGSANNGGGMSSGGSMNGGGTRFGGPINDGGTNNGGATNGGGTNNGGATNGGGTNNGGSTNGGGTNNGGATNGGGTNNGGSVSGGGLNPLNGMEMNGNGRNNGGGTGNGRVVAPSTRRPTQRASIAPKIDGNHLADAGFGFVFGPFGRNAFGKK